MHTTSGKSLLVFTLITMFGAAAVFAPPNSKKVNGTLNGTVVYTPPVVAAGTYAIRVECTGTLPHLGRARAVWEGSALVDASLAATALPGAAWNIESADGSTMRGPVQWHAQNGTAPGDYTVTGPFQIVGSTGRFQGTSGGGTIRGALNVLTGKATIQS